MQSERITRLLLNYRSFGSPSDPVVFFLHGLMGSSANWITVCRTLSAAGFYCIAVDLRNHGSSFHSRRMNYSLMAEDIITLADSLCIDCFAAVGHSMGGKVAMETALSFPERVEKLVVADIAPVNYPAETTGYIRDLKQLPLSDVKKRSDAEAVLAPYFPDAMILRFLLTNLKRESDGSYCWRVDLDTIIENLPMLSCWPDSGKYSALSALFIRGGRSEFIGEQELAAVSKYFPYARVETLEDSGHWVHAEQPAEFLAAVREYLTMASKNATMEHEQF